MVQHSNDNRGDWIQTYTGRAFYPLDPRPEDIDIVDIAHSLAMQCRFCGHCLSFYSVAEHSVLLARHASPPNKLWALLHDASEAYLTDVPRPIKPMLGSYKGIETRLQYVIAARFGLPPDIPSEVHDADRRILTDEAMQNMACAPMDWNTAAEPLGVRLRLWDPGQAKVEFLSEFVQLLEDTRLAA